MKKAKRKICLLLALSLIWVAFAAHLPLGQAQTPKTESALAFLGDVVKFDVHKYTVTSLSGPFTDIRTDLGGLVDVHGVYHLKSQTSRVDVLFHFINGTLCSSFLDVIEGSPEFSITPSSAKDAAKAFLQGYSDFTLDSSSIALSQIIDAIDVAKNATQKTGNLSLNVLTTPSFTSLKWKNTFNNATYSGLTVEFQNGVFYSFFDDRSYMKVGNTEVNLSEEQAISKALGESSKFWYTYKGTNYTGLAIVENSVRAELLTAPKDNPLELYPYWKVTLPLNGDYPGFVTMIIVEFWAGTGDLLEIFPLGTGGGPDSGDSSPAPSASSQPSSSPASSSSPAGSASPFPDSSPTTEPPASQAPASTASPSSSSQQTAPPSLQPADNAGDQKSIDFSLLVAVAAVCVGVAVAVSLTLMYRRKRG